MHEFLDKAVLDGHTQAVSGSGEALLAALQGEASDRATAWLSLWWLAAQDDSAVARRALAYAIAIDSREGKSSSVMEAIRVWLLDCSECAKDPSNAITLLAGLEACAEVSGSFPATARTLIGPFLHVLVTHADLNVVSACLDFLEHAATTSTLVQILNRAAAASLHAALAARVRSHADDEDLARDIQFLANAELNENAPHHHRDLVRLALDVADALEATEFPEPTPPSLISVIRRRALLDEALAQAIRAGSAVQTVRVLRDDPPAELLQSVVEFSKAVVSVRRPPRSEDDEPRETAEYGIRFRSALAASYPIHITYVDDDAKAVFDALSDVLVAATREAELVAAIEKLAPPVLEAAQKLLQSLVDAKANLEITLSQPTLADWQISTHGNFDRLSHQVLNRVAKRMRQVLRGRQVWVDQSDVPQANTVSLVFKVVDVMIKQGYVTDADVDTLNSARQINYYRQAARILGLLDADNQPTARGQAMHGLECEDQMKLGAVYFEDTVIGRAWRSWAGVSRLPELDGDTAEKFLNDCVVGLTGTTPRRRASTLKQWLDDLVPYHCTARTSKG